MLQETQEELYAANTVAMASHRGAVAAAEQKLAQTSDAHEAALELRKCVTLSLFNCKGLSSNLGLECEDSGS